MTRLVAAVVIKCLSPIFSVPNLCSLMELLPCHVLITYYTASCTYCDVCSDSLLFIMIDKGHQLRIVNV